jgi:hypothetical protein
MNHLSTVPSILCAEAIRLSFEDMDFIVMCRLPWVEPEGPSSAPTNIYPEDMRMCLGSRMSL